MARIKEQSVREAVAAADMVDLVSGRVRLRRIGARYSGLCPFHDERTPSFSVNAQDKLYYCFGCGRGGDLIDFVRETEQLDFAGAVEWLAGRYGVTLEYEELSPQLDADRRRRQRLYDLLEQACAFYERHLWESKAGEPVRAYLAERGLGEGVCREYRLGLAPGGDILVRKALEKGFGRDELAAVGLANRRGRDYFARRLLFALADPRGRVVGFGARRLHEDDPVPAKYVNSPEGELFRKGSTVYGLDRARAALARENRACVVEGYTDVLALRQAGIAPVVASMGTALTERQLKELARLARVVYLCFDADAAGEAATLRGMELAAAEGLDVRVVALPPGSDPAEAADGFEERLRAAEPYLRYRVRLEIERAPDRQAGFERVRELLGRFQDSPQRQDAIRLAADRLDLPRELQAGLAPYRRAAASAGFSPKLLEAGERLERMFLAACLLDPEAARPLVRELNDDHFAREEHRRLRAYLTGESEGGDTAALRAELWATAEKEGITPERARGLALELQERWVERQISALEGESMSREDERRHAELVQLHSKIREAVTDLA
ncbi:MAG: DNA primase [Thermoleophilia bacterium]|nr:DNA primase [Thermoleophilia bacterium]